MLWFELIKPAHHHLAFIRFLPVLNVCKAARVLNVCKAAHTLSDKCCHGNWGNDVTFERAIL